MTDNEFSISTLISNDFTQEHKNHLFKSTRYKFGGQLIEELMEFPQPIIIKIEEEFVPRELYMSPDDHITHYEFMISAKVSSVQHQHIIIGVPEYVSKKLTFVEKLKWLFSK